LTVIRRKGHSSSALVMPLRTRSFASPVGPTTQGGTFPARQPKLGPARGRFSETTEVHS
jgi:hypothetical protein